MHACARVRSFILLLLTFHCTTCTNVHGSSDTYTSLPLVQRLTCDSMRTGSGPWPLATLLQLEINSSVREKFILIFTQKFQMSVRLCWYKRSCH